MIANNSTKLRRIIFICYIARNKMKKQQCVSIITSESGVEENSMIEEGGAGVDSFIHVTRAIVLFNM